MDRPGKRHYFRFEFSFFISADTGWAVGGAETIIKTTNGGNIWEEAEIPSRDPINGFSSVYFTSSNTGYVVGGSKILITTDYGENWNSVTSPVEGTNNLLRSVFFINDSTGWIVGDHGAVYKTDDEGKNWTQQTANDSDNYYSVYFFDDSTGWIAGGMGSGTSPYGHVYRTTDGGNNWMRQRADIKYDLNCIRFESKKIGWTAGQAGSYKTGTGNSVLIFKSTDGGENWMPYTTSMYNDLSSIFFTSDSSGWIAGQNGAVLKTTTGGGDFIQPSGYAAIKNYSGQKTPDNFVVLQNYPNPFNPSTVISYSIPVGGKVVITVFDILGRKVKEMVNEIKPAGNYRVTFNAYKLSSGVYFYSLRIGKYYKVKKMMLLR